MMTGMGDESSVVETSVERIVVEGRFGFVNISVQRRNDMTGDWWTKHDCGLSVPVYAVASLVTAIMREADLLRAGGVSDASGADSDE